MTQTLDKLSAAATQGEWLPCPFCGGQAQITERPQSSKDTGFFCAISCFCGGYSAHAHQHGIAETKEAARHEAIAAWNTRTGQLVAVQPDDATVERVKDAIGTSLAYDIGMDVRAGSLTDDEKRKLARKAIAAMEGPKP